MPQPIQPGQHELGAINVYDFNFYAGEAAADQMDSDVLARVGSDETPVVVEFPQRPPRTLHTPDEVFDWFDGRFDDHEDPRSVKYPSLGHTAVMHMPARTTAQEAVAAEAALRDHSRRINPENKRRYIPESFFGSA